MTDDIVKHLMARRNDFPDFIQLLRNQTLRFKCSISMSKHSIAYTFTHIEYFSISWVNQAIDIKLQFFLGFLRELRCVHNISCSPPQRNMVINTESVGRIAYFS